MYMSYKKKIDISVRYVKISRTRLMIWSCYFFTQKIWPMHKIGGKFCLLSSVYRKTRTYHKDNKIRLIFFKGSRNKRELQLAEKMSWISSLKYVLNEYSTYSFFVYNRQLFFVPTLNIISCSLINSSHYILTTACFFYAQISSGK